MSLIALDGYLEIYGAIGHLQQDQLLFRFCCWLQQGQLHFAKDISLLTCALVWPTSAMASTINTLATH